MTQPFLTHAFAQGDIDELRLEAQRERLARQAKARARSLETPSDWSAGGGATTGEEQR